MSKLGRPATPQNGRDEAIRGEKKRGNRVLVYAGLSCIATVLSLEEQCSSTYVCSISITTTCFCFYNFEEKRIRGPLVDVLTHIETVYIVNVAGSVVKQYHQHS